MIGLGQGRGGFTVLAPSLAVSPCAGGVEMTVALAFASTGISADGAVVSETTAVEELENGIPFCTLLVSGWLRASACLSEKASVNVRFWERIFCDKPFSLDTDGLVCHP